MLNTIDLAEVGNAIFLGRGFFLSSLNAIPLISKCASPLKLFRELENPIFR
jgi:hypothetical protein